MLSSIYISIPFLSITLAAASSFHSRSHHLAKRDDSVGAAAALTSINQLITPACNTTCSYITSDIISCGKGDSQQSIAACACSSQVLGHLRSCASCISVDASVTPANASAVVSNYNNFVGLCTTNGLATVTGTVDVGAQTVAEATSAILTSTAIPITYAAPTTTSTAIVQSLVAPTTKSSSILPTTATTSSTVAKATTTASAGRLLHGSIGGITVITLLSALLI